MSDEHNEDGPRDLVPWQRHSQQMSDRKAIATYFPNNKWADIARCTVEIRSWDDFQRVFLMGWGKSARTYKDYMWACKSFYNFLGGQHPMSARPEDVEQWYDKMDVALPTKRKRIMGLKFMYKNIKEMFPMYASPFDIMDKALLAKINRKGTKSNKQDALTAKEYQAVLDLLEKDKSGKGLWDYALFRYGITSGMRLSPLVAHTWGKIIRADIDEKAPYRTTFMAKGSKWRTIELETEAVEALERAFVKQWGRKPEAEDHILTSNQNPTMHRNTLNNHLERIRKRAVSAGIMRKGIMLTAHTMRHTCATRLLSVGTDIETVRRHLGHSNINITMTYLHNDESLAKAWSEMSGKPIPLIWREIALNTRKTKGSHYPGVEVVSLLLKIFAVISWLIGLTGVGISIAIGMQASTAF